MPVTSLSFLHSSKNKVSNEYIGHIESANRQVEVMTKYYCPDHPATQLLGRLKQTTEKSQSTQSPLPEIMVCPIDGKHHTIKDAIERIDHPDYDFD